MALFRVGPLPADPMAAAAAFHADVQPRLIATLDAAAGPVTLVFAPADHAHREWRMAAVAMLARARAPQRVNAVESGYEPAIAAAAAYLAGAEGVTGQVLPLDSLGAGDVIASRG